MSEIPRELRRNLLVEVHGTVDQQKDALVEYVYDISANPEKWPLTDGQRINFLKEILQRVRQIRTTEAACRSTTEE